MPIPKDEMAQIVLATLDWQISAAIGARDSMRAGSPSWRYGHSYVHHLVHYYNVLLKYGGGVFNKEFDPPMVPPLVMPEGM